MARTQGHAVCGPLWLVSCTRTRPSNLQRKAKAIARQFVTETYL